MSKTYMLQLRLGTRQLMRWAAARRLGDDLGYTCHAWMCDAFGDLRLQPFTVKEKMGVITVLGYGTADSTEMQACLSETAEPEVAECFLGLAGKEMPSQWLPGKQYRFEVRVAPTRQSTRPDGRKWERDAFLLADPNESRSDVYLKWLKARLSPAVNLPQCQITGYSSIRACRRSETTPGKRPSGEILLPEAHFEGILEIKDAEVFRALLHTGVGRHKAFGFGALMLRPPGTV